MKHRIFLAVLLVFTVLLSIGASKQPSERQRMSIFISNFTEQTMFNFDMEEDGDDSLIHLGDPEYSEQLRLFGITHNVINNYKSTIKTCPDKKCPYGKNIISGQAVANTIRKYFDVSVKNKSIDEVQDDIFAAHYDGKNYHLNAARLRDNYKERVLYADVQDVSRDGNIITMSGELYDTKNKSGRPATFTATAKPHVWNDKDTWAILSLSVEWR